MMKISRNNATYFWDFQSFLKTQVQAYHTQILLPNELDTSICILLQESRRSAQNKAGVGPK